MSYATVSSSRAARAAVRAFASAFAPARGSGERGAAQSAECCGEGAHALSHDFRADRRLFELPLKIKFEMIEREAAAGKTQVAGGALAAALQHYAKASLYLEYCFPETATEKERYNKLGEKIFLNMSLILHKQDKLHESIEAARNARRFNETSRKATYRLVVAHAQLRNAKAAELEIRGARSRADHDLVALCETAVRQAQSAQRATEIAVAKSLADIYKSNKREAEG